MDGRLFPLLALGAWTAACDGSAGPPRAVVLITCDTLRADRLGFMGCPRGTSPSLDALARESIVFDAAWSTAPLTGPALSAMLTGRPPEELGLADNRQVLAGEAETLAERLAANGVDTAAIVSNWVLRRRPELPGAGVQQGFAHFDDRMDTLEPARPDLRERLAPATTDAAIAWLEQRSVAEPFFLWVHYQDPHGPYTPPRECLHASDGAAEGEPPLEVGADQRGAGELPAYQAVDDERRPAVYRARYEAEVRFFDRELGRLVEHLRTSGLLERALVVFTADHGESLGERGFYFSHGQHLHRELVHVPLLVRPPGGTVERRVATAPVSHLDVAPTVLRFLGVEPGASRGLDLLAAEPALERTLPQFLRGAWGATDGSHRLLVADGRARLYALDSDPGEEHDLAQRMPELVRALTERHHAFARAGGPPIAAAQPAEEAGDEAGMRALGYVGDEDEDDGAED